MSWVVDTCLIIDVLEDDPDFGESSAALLESVMNEGLSICPVSYVELAPAFLGNRRRQDAFLSAIGIDLADGWTSNDTQSAHQAWARQIGLKRKGQGPKHPIADILIGAYASVRTGLLTRNCTNFAAVFTEGTTAFVAVVKSYSSSNSCHDPLPCVIMGAFHMKECTSSSL